MQVTEGDGYYLGRVLINAQTVAGYVLTLRLRHNVGSMTGTHEKRTTGNRTCCLLSDIL